MFNNLLIENDLLGNIDFDVIINDLHLKMLKETISYEFLNKEKFFDIL
jgi:hypothetical protein